VRFGELPIQSSPDHPYPDDQSVPHGDQADDDPVETAIYPVHEPTLDDGTLEFFVELGDLFDSFCAGQAAVTPLCDPPDSFSFERNEQGECAVQLRDPDGNTSTIDVPCWRGYICYMYKACVCKDDACDAIDYRQIYFRMKPDGAEMTADVRFNNEPVYYEIDFE